MAVRSRFKSLCTAAALTAGLAMAAAVVTADPPTTYNAHTDLNYYNNPTKGQAYPALPNWGGAVGAGTIIKDPAFGCPILRATDSNTESDLIGRPFTTPSSSEQRSWNLTSTMFYCLDAYGGRINVFNFDTTNFKATLRTGDTHRPTVIDDFSATNANVAYGHVGTQVVSYNFSTNTQTVLFDAQTLTSINLNGRITETHVSRTDNVISLICGGTAQDTDFLVIYYNTATNLYHILNTQTNAIDANPPGSAGLVGTPGFIHNAVIDLEGRYIHVDNASNSPNMTIAIWDTYNGGTCYPFGPQNSGHCVFGYGPDKGTAWVNTGDSLTQTMPPNGEKNVTWLIRKVTPLGVKTYNDLVEHPLSDACYFGYDNHVSWNNSTSSASQPVFADTYHENGVADPQCVWGDEIIALGTALTSGNPVYRFAQHRSIQNKYANGVQFYDQPRGNISQDGNYFMFTSNYGNSLGTYVVSTQNYGNITEYREDVFIIHLNQSATK